MSPRLGEGASLSLVECEMELCSKDICHGSIPKGLAIVERVDAVLVVGERSDEVQWAVLAMSRYCCRSTWRSC
jgi:hypothetical protein